MSTGLLPLTLLHPGRMTGFHMKPGSPHSHSAFVFDLYIAVLLSYPFPPSSSPVGLASHYPKVVLLKFLLTGPRQNKGDTLHVCVSREISDHVWENVCFA